MAGRLRIGDPLPFTWRQLDDMDWALRVEQWEHTSHLLATLTNINRDKGKRAVPPDFFNQYKKLVVGEPEPAETKEVLPPHLRY